MSKSRKSNRIVARWPGELEAAETHTAARIEFLAAIERNHPVVLRELRKAAMPHFRRLLVEAGISAKQFNELADRALQNRIWEDLSSIVYQWARRFHLVMDVGAGHASTFQPAKHWSLWNRGRSLFDWLVQVCADSLGVWAASKSRRTLAWCLEPIQQRLQLLRVAPVFLFVTAPWVPDKESLKAFHQRAGREFEQALKEYTSSIASTLTASEVFSPPSVSKSVDPMLTAMLQARAGMVIPPMASSLSAGFVRAHFEWLVLHQVQGLSWPRISIKTKPVVTWRAVKAGVQAAAEQVVGDEWSNWLRKGTPGRPKKR